MYVGGGGVRWDIWCWFGVGVDENGLMMLDYGRLGMSRLGK